MAIIGIKSLRYGVEDVARSALFFTDFGLSPIARDGEGALFALADGSTVEILPLRHASLPQSEIQGQGVREVIWGVDTCEALDGLVAALSADHVIQSREGGAQCFIPSFGIAMGLEHWVPRRVVNAPDPLNAPGVVNRLNTHRKWRRTAQPKVINHVVFKTTDFERAASFMRTRLGFRLSDLQKGFGCYLRADGSNNHHNILFLNAHAPLPGCDGMTRFDHANFGVEDIDELMVGANNMVRKGWEDSHVGLGRHRIDSALFYYLPCPAGGEAEYGADADYIDDSWVPRHFTTPLFAYSHFTHHIPDFLREPPAWDFSYLTEDQIRNGVSPAGE